ncbi:Hypothetical Protein NTJ_05256 [Nesidiocoris tenuis]|uniref:Peptidase A2 domain-containing protein n=1 Tax=Nesidiocoris tenuis TaxID=355587 RepID=A0ABN7ANG6_9HEMI|nr:Hypothetical Protein NTJ_05256 [Nesidiocoris tenuis]
MLFDTGATKTVISEKVWREIGSPPLKKSSSLLAYTGVKVDTLGKAKVLVKAFGKELKLQVLVTKQEDIPLFGMNWLIAFDVPMPKETRIRTLTNTAQIPEKQTEIDKDVAKIVEKTTPQRTTGKTPAEMMFGRKIKTRLDLLKPNVQDRIDAAVVRQKIDHDKKSKEKNFQEGSTVWVLNNDGKNFVEGKIERKTGLYSYIVEIGGVLKKKHAEQLRRRETK